MKRVIVLAVVFLLVFASTLVPMPDFLSHTNLTGGGLQRAEASDLSSDTVDQITVDNGTSLPFQRKVVYAASHFWVVYDNGTDLVVKSSAIGAAWSSATVIIAGETDASALSVWFDGTYICMAYAAGIPNVALQYKEFHPKDDGTIEGRYLIGYNWQVAIAASENLTYSYPSVCKDTSGYPIIAYYGKDDNTIKVIESSVYAVKSAQNDGTWTSNTFSSCLQTGDSDATWKALILPLGSQDLMAIYARDGQPVKSEVYDFGTTTWLGENTTTTDINKGSYFSAVVTSDNVVHLAYAGDTPGNLRYTHYHSGGSAWEAEEELYTGSSATMVPVLSRTLDDSLYCFWIGDPSASVVYYRARISGSWDASETVFQTEMTATSTGSFVVGFATGSGFYAGRTGEGINYIGFEASTDALVNDSLTATYEQTTATYLGVAWLFGSGSSYDVRFAGKDLEEDTSGLAIEVSPTTLSGSWAYKSGIGSPTNIIKMDQWYTTELDLADAKFTLTNTGNVTADIQVSSQDWTGTGVTWHVSNTGDAGDHTIGLWAGLIIPESRVSGAFIVGFSTIGKYYVGTDNEGVTYIGFGQTGFETSQIGDYEVVIKAAEPWNYLRSGLVDGTSQDFGLLLYSCKTNGGSAIMTGVVSLTASIHV